MSQLAAESADKATTPLSLVERLAAFSGSPDQFLSELLQAQCQLASADGGAFMRFDGQKSAEIVSAYPPIKQPKSIPRWIAQAIESLPSVTSSKGSVVIPMHREDAIYGEGPAAHIALLPLRSGQRVRGIVAFCLPASEEAILAHRYQTLELTMPLLSLYEMRITLEQRSSSLQLLRRAVVVLAAVNAESRFKAATMALCNQVASRWQAERVSLGFLQGKYVKLAALSHTEKFSRKTKLVQDIESAMEECLDQDVEVLFPAAEGTAYIHRAAESLSTHHGPTLVASFPLRRDGEPKAVLTVEFAPDRGSSAEDLEALRLGAELCTSRLLDLYETDQWFGIRAMNATKKGLGHLIGPKHTWPKLGGLAACALVAFMIFVKGEYKVEAPVVIETIERQVVPAPFEGYLKSVDVEVGDPVIAGKTVMADLDANELNIQLASALAERTSYMKEAQLAEREGKTAEKEIAQAKVNSVNAKIRLLRHKIDKATIKAPITGVVIKGDLKKQIGAPLETGQMLFEIAPVEAMRANLMVSDDSIAEITVGQGGQMATASHPGDFVDFTIERISPIATVAEGANVFEVRAELENTKDWLKPGVKGLAKVDLGKRSYGYIWTRDLVNWVRMKLWM